MIHLVLFGNSSWPHKLVLCFSASKSKKIARPSVSSDILFMSISVLVIFLAAKKEVHGLALWQNKTIFPQAPFFAAKKNDGGLGALARSWLRSLAKQNNRSSVSILPQKKWRGFRGPCSFFGQFWHPIPFHAFRSCQLPCHQKKGFVASLSGKTKQSFLSLHSLRQKKRRGFRGPCSFFGRFWHPIPFHAFRSCHLLCHQKKGFVAWLSGKAKQNRSSVSILCRKKKMTGV